MRFNLGCECLCPETGTASPGNVTTRRLTSALSQVWIADYTDPQGAGSLPETRGLALQPSSTNLWVCGARDPGGTITAKEYNRNTGTATGRSVDHGAILNDVFVDSSGNVYVGGQEALTGTIGVHVRKYNSALVEQWTVDWRSANPVFHLYVDSSGNVYVVGSNTEVNVGTGDNVTFRKYNSSGAMQWERSPGWDNTFGDAGDMRDVVEDSQGDLIVCGTPADTGGVTEEVYKFNSAGTQQWAKDHRSGIAQGCAVDQFDNIYVAYSDGALLKLDSNGDVKWTYTDATKFSAAGRVAVDQNNDVYFTYFDFGGVGNPSQAGIIKVSDTGSFIAEFEHSNKISGANVQDVVVDPIGTGETGTGSGTGGVDDVVYITGSEETS